MVLGKEIPPPWVPELRSETDFQYFDEYTDNNNDFEIELPEEVQSIFENF